MNLSMPAHLALNYKSAAQQARVVSEAWGQSNLYCPNCWSPYLNPAPSNTRAFDYFCPSCGLPFQLKCQSSPIRDRIVDAGFDAMMQAIREDRTPNLYALHYNRTSWQVQDLILVPHFALSASSIERRNPLTSGARRSGWVGCFIVLKNIPSDAKINIVAGGALILPHKVRESFHRLRPLKEVSVKERGWTLDVLRVVRSLGKKEFTNNEMYAFASELERLHPENRHVRDKIRQQLQFLRDRGFLVQVRRTVWALKED